MAAHAKHERKGSYPLLGLEMAIDFVIMYLVMYTMIATLDHLIPNLNNVYMTLMMVAPMTILMLVFMWSMYPSRRLNWIIIAVAALVFIASFAAMRTQAAIGDKELVKAMIPHHSGAILMCQQSMLTDPELIKLCGEIVKAQEREIAQMKAMLARY